MGDGWSFSASASTDGGVTSSGSGGGGGVTAVATKNAVVCNAPWGIRPDGACGPCPAGTSTKDGVCQPTAPQEPTYCALFMGIKTTAKGTPPAGWVPVQVPGTLWGTQTCWMPPPSTYCVLANGVRTTTTVAPPASWEKRSMTLNGVLTTCSVMPSKAAPAITYNPSTVPAPVFNYSPGLFQRPTDIEPLTILPQPAPKSNALYWALGAAAGLALVGAIVISQRSSENEAS